MSNLIVLLCGKVLLGAIAKAIHEDVSDKIRARVVSGGPIDIGLMDSTFENSMKMYEELKVSKVEELALDMSDKTDTALEVARETFQAAANDLTFGAVQKILKKLAGEQIQKSLEGIPEDVADDILQLAMEATDEMAKDMGSQQQAPSKASVVIQEEAEKEGVTAAVILVKDATS